MFVPRAARLSARRHPDRHRAARRAGRRRRLDPAAGASAARLRARAVAEPERKLGVRVRRDERGGAGRVDPAGRFRRRDASSCPSRGVRRRRACRTAPTSAGTRGRSRFPIGWRGRRVYLVVGASDWRTSVWLDGAKVGEHQGGYTPFSVELTSNAKLRQRAASRDPRGRQRRTRSSSRGSRATAKARGMWQTVYLEARGGDPIEARALHPGPRRDRASAVDAAARRARAARSHAALAITNRASMPVGRRAHPPWRVARRTSTSRFPNARLWSLEDPFLHEVSASVSGEGVATDSVRTYFGMRTISTMDLPGTKHPVRRDQRQAGLPPARARPGVSSDGLLHLPVGLIHAHGDPARATDRPERTARAHQDRDAEEAVLGRQAGRADHGGRSQLVGSADRHRVPRARLRDARDDRARLQPSEPSSRGSSYNEAWGLISKVERQGRVPAGDAARVSWNR